MTKEYIEREALKQDLKESYDRLREIYYGLTYDEDKQICAGQLTTFTEAILRVKDAPAADVVEVVRCKDCKWYSELACGERELLGSQGWCNEVMARPMPSNGFCSFGERKKGHGQTNGIQNGI